MHGRFVQHSPSREYAGMLGIEHYPDNLGSRYSIAPSQIVKIGLLKMRLNRNEA